MLHEKQLKINSKAPVACGGLHRPEVLAGKGSARGLSAWVVSALPHRQQWGWGIILIPSPQRAPGKELWVRASFSSCTSSNSFLLGPWLPDPSHISFASSLVVPRGLGHCLLMRGLQEIPTPRPRKDLVFGLTLSLPQANVGTWGPPHHSLKTGMGWHGESGVTMAPGLVLQPWGQVRHFLRTWWSTSIPGD